MVPAAAAGSLTVIITTSPTPSNPATELLSFVLLSFRKHCPSLADCPVIVVFDTYEQITFKARLKKGRVTAEGAKNFEIYKEKAKELILGEYCEDANGCVLVESQAEAEFGITRLETNAVDMKITQTEDKQVTFIEPSDRLGFGLAVRSALRITATPYVWIQQHDWTLDYDIPLEPLLEVMKDSESSEQVPVKYICLPSVRMLSYATSAHVAEHQALREFTASLKGNFTPKSHPNANLPLTPLFFWHDKPHIASTVHYLARVFPSRLAMRRGEFIEDKIGQRAREQMKQGLWTKWACWLYYPDEGKQVCLKHLKGRTWRGTDTELEKKLAHIAKNSKRKKISCLELKVSE